MKIKFSAKRIALLGFFLALSLIVSILESLLPPIIPVLPYAKIGFTNIVLLACFLMLGTVDGFIVLILRCLFSAIYAGNISSLIWAFPAALVAYIVMILLFKCKIFSTVGLSMAGGIIHNVVQILVSIIILGPSVAYYLPYMMLAGSLAGLVTGIVCHIFVERFKYYFINLDSKEIEYFRDVDED